MANITPYIRAQYPTIEGNDRVYFDNEFRKIQECLRGVVAALAAPYNHPSIIIASGVATMTEASPSMVSTVNIDTEAAGATDDLNTIDWPSGHDGQVVTVYANNSARTVVLKDSVDNLILAGDMTLDNNGDSITLQCWSNIFWELARSNNAA